MLEQYFLGPTTLVCIKQLSTIAGVCRRVPAGSELE